VSALRACACAALLLTLSCEDPAPALRVFAAASLRDVAGDLAAEYQAATGVRVALNFAGTQALAQQLRAGAHGDVFLSADQHWMDVVKSAGVVEPDTVTPFATNQLVLVARDDSAFSLRSVADLPDLRFTRLCMGFPDAVPAGRYARRALDAVPSGTSTVWAKVKSRVAPTADVRQALALVEADPRHVGVVYRTDAYSSERVTELGRLEGEARYYAARVAQARRPEDARAFLDYLATDRARSTLRVHGFTTARGAR
jgi:molybdate transport system substrate-binding protein